MKQNMHFKHCNSIAQLRRVGKPYKEEVQKSLEPGANSHFAVKHVEIPSTKREEVQSSLAVLIVTSRTFGKYSKRSIHSSAEMTQRRRIPKLRLT